MPVLRLLAERGRGVWPRAATRYSRASAGIAASAPATRGIRSTLLDATTRYRGGDCAKALNVLGGSAQADFGADLPRGEFIAFMLREFIAFAERARPSAAFARHNCSTPSARIQSTLRIDYNAARVHRLLRARADERSHSLKTTDRLQRCESSPLTHGVVFANIGPIARAESLAFPCLASAALTISLDDQARGVASQRGRMLRNSRASERGSNVASGCFADRLRSCFLSKNAADGNSESRKTACYANRHEGTGALGGTTERRAFGRAVDHRSKGARFDGGAFGSPG